MKTSSFNKILSRLIKFLNIQCLFFIYFSSFQHFKKPCLIIHTAIAVNFFVKRLYQSQNVICQYVVQSTIPSYVSVCSQGFKFRQIYSWVFLRLIIIIFSSCLNVILFIDLLLTLTFVILIMILYLVLLTILLQQFFGLVFLPSDFEKN